MEHPGRIGLAPKLVVSADGRGVVNHAGSRLLADLADATGLTASFTDALRRLRHRARPEQDRGGLNRGTALTTHDPRNPGEPDPRLGPQPCPPSRRRPEPALHRDPTSSATRSERGGLRVSGFGARRSSSW